MSSMRITQAVGLGGVNNNNDVKAVQTALNKLLKLIPSTKILTVDGRLGSRPENSKTVAAIKLFQSKVVGMIRADGKVDVNGRSHRKINEKLTDFEKLQVAQNMVLSKYFKWSEFACHDSSKTPVPNEYKNNVKILAEQLSVLREKIAKPIHINCGYRTPEHNSKVGGVSSSCHLTAKAADISVKGMTPKEVHKAILDLISEGKIREGGLGLYNTFVHYDIRGTAARWGNK
ncbi:D-Ala-D-Ala carboxypeptidase family metallohydrolase [Psychromonas sp. PT13]|uniref:D-Ala-D-Ala carboxypeptidase family metallohydrolase n=1 Tax=Psychromonas sp. PT13 TaxID=3439547 RepID=UPI003EBFBEFA